MPPDGGLPRCRWLGPRMITLHIQSPTEKHFDLRPRIERLLRLLIVLSLIFSKVVLSIKIP